MLFDLQEEIKPKISNRLKKLREKKHIIPEAISSSNRSTIYAIEKGQAQKLNDNLLYEYYENFKIKKELNFW
ncbi:hypothetical protein QPJ54_000441 [Listeria monocytogenes]|nr:hypothetical protein [Listeria monocytogenes]EHC5236749.1 hypothetical protein [Listeria monocytogenes serotype 1/2a]ECC2753939.1 hypothetical protein [Listeria monocytogenes]EHC6021757.1 hypothetical protein [Listeria monocytogenes serotype 1/2a]EHC6256611.1 hypothetical protein [Listeria monocytogenes serotype 1/2a]